MQRVCHIGKLCDRFAGHVHVLEKGLERAGGQAAFYKHPTAEDRNPCVCPPRNVDLVGGDGRDQQSACRIRQRDK